MKKLVALVAVSLFAQQQSPKPGDSCNPHDSKRMMSGDAKFILRCNTEGVLVVDIASMRHADSCVRLGETFDMPTGLCKKNSGTINTK